MSVHPPLTDSTGNVAGGLMRQSRISLLGLPVDRLTLPATLDSLMARIEEQRSSGPQTPPQTTQVVTLNPEIFMRARAQPRLRAIIQAADFVVADGAGILWAARLLGEPLPGRVPGVDLAQGLAQRAADHGYRLFLLGAAPGVAEQAAARLERDYPGLHVAGTFAGVPQREGDEEAIARIQAARADILLVAYGSPAQEYWIEREQGRLDVAVAIGVGGAFDFLAGRVPRAPQWMRARGLEWLYRLWREPWRWRRMLVLPRFVLLILLAAPRAKIRRGVAS